MANFRNATGNRRQWCNTVISSGFSNFSYIDDELFSDPVLRRIFSLARKLKFQSLIVEDISESESRLFQEENEDLAKRCADYKSSQAKRILFLKTKVDGEPTEKCLLGYIIFKIDKFKSHFSYHVYESVMIPPRDAGSNNFVHTAKTYKVNSSIGALNVRGVLYAQQNDKTFVCAHVALRTILATMLSQDDVTYREMNNILGIDHKNEMIGDGKGLSPERIELVLQHFGVNFEKYSHEPKESVFYPSDFQRDLYASIESTCPALLGFTVEVPGKDPELNRHIIPVIGHTFNEDTWVAEATRTYFNGGPSYFPSENWLSTYLLHDDNFGPYYCLPRHYLKNDNFRLLIGLKKNQTNVSAVEAEAVASDLLSGFAESFNLEGGEWLARFFAFSRHGLLVLRTLHLTKMQYLKHLSELSCRNVDEKIDEKSIKWVESILPDQFWMVEFSAPELFSASRRKFGELLIDPMVPMDESTLLTFGILARLPEVFVELCDPNESGSPKIEPTNLNSHTPLFSFSKI